jgi:hypothetical protein
MFPAALANGARVVASKISPRIGTVHVPIQKSKLTEPSYTRRW